jgi:hypothetical protein
LAGRKAIACRRDARRKKEVVRILNMRYGSASCWGQSMERSQQV